MAYLDTHCHLQDPRLSGNVDFAAMRGLGIRRWVVNGTRESDWAEVSRLARLHREIRPSFGLHPWRVDGRSPDWLENLRVYLDSHPKAAIGEIGLDRWIEGYDAPTQESVFLAQLSLAARENRPVSIHCLRAWGRMLELLQQHPLPERGFLLHSYGGSAEMVDAFADLGGYFSFCGHFLHSRKIKARETFRRVPIERLLIETDAPDQVLPENLDRFGLIDEKSGQRINHPANLAAIYEGAADALEISPDVLSEQVEANFRRLFAPPGQHEGAKKC